MSKSMIDDILGQIIALTDEDEDKDGDHSPADVEIASHRTETGDLVDPEGQAPEHEIEIQPEEATIEVGSPDGDGDEDLLDALDDLDYDDDSHHEETDELDDELEQIDKEEDEPTKKRRGFGSMRRW